MEEEKNKNRKLTEEVLAIEHKDNAINKINSTINYHIITKEYKQSHLLSYWFEDFCEYHKNEKDFDSAINGVIRKGTILKVNFGYNIGSELGGLHYCIVLTKFDNLKNNTLTVVPLTSKKSNKKYHKNTVFLGKEIYNKFSEQYNFIYNQFKSFKKNINLKKDIIIDNNLNNELLKMENDLAKIKKFIDRYDKESIALINQITTISKQRIYKDILTYKKIRISNDTMDVIDKAIIKQFLK